MSENESIEEKTGEISPAIDEIETENTSFEFIKKPPVEAPPLKEGDDLDVSESVDRDINKQLGIKEPEKDKEEKGEGGEDRRKAFNVDEDNLLLQHIYEMVNNLFNLLAETLGEPELNKVKEAKEENMVIARVLYRYSGKLKRETLDSIQFVIVIFKKIARTKWFKKAVEKRTNKAQ